MNSAIFGLLIDWPMFFFFFWLAQVSQSWIDQGVKSWICPNNCALIYWIKCSYQSSICFSDVLFQQFWDKIHLIKIEKEAIEDLTIVWTYGL